MSLNNKASASTTCSVCNGILIQVEEDMFDHGLYCSECNEWYSEEPHDLEKIIVESSLEDSNFHHVAYNLRHVCLFQMVVYTILSREECILGTRPVVYMGEIVFCRRCVWKYDINGV